MEPYLGNMEHMRNPIDAIWSFQQPKETFFLSFPKICFPQKFFTFFSRCNNEQAIVLASYSLQAETGDHDPERHTLENLQDLPLLPKIIMSQLSEERYGNHCSFI